MSEERKNITFEQLARAQQQGLNHILDNLEVTGKAVIRDKHGRIKGKLRLGNVKVNKGKGK